MDILDTYFRDHFYPFTKHHIDSYREFLRKYIPDVIKFYNPITMVKFKNNKESDIELKVDIYIGGKEGKNLYIDRPTQLENGNPVILTPHECRLKNLTYSTHLYADVLVEYFINGAVQPIQKSFSHILLGDIPLMLHSDGCILHQQGPQVLRAFDECPFDQGGYFIIDGKEKVVISQERMVTNRLFIEKAKDPRYSFKGWIRCATDTGDSALLPKTVEFYILNPNYNTSEIESDENDEEEKEDEDPSEQSAYVKYRGAILVSIPNIKTSKRIPLFELFRAFGVESDKEIVEHIFGPIEDSIPSEYIDFITPSIRHCVDSKNPIYTQTQAIEHLKDFVRYKSNEHVHSILTNDVFPNMGIDYQAKAKFLGYLIRYMMDMMLGTKPMADRDAFGYKRIDLSGFLVSQLFHNIYKRFRKNCRDLLDQEYHYGPTRNTGHFEEMIRKENIQKIISPMFITERLQRSLKGLWGSSDDDEKQEKVQDLARISYIGFMSNLRRLNTPLDRSIKITAPHRLNAQQWGIVCPFESPDGASIGYLKNFSLLSNVSFGTDPNHFKECLEDLDFIPLSRILPAMCHVYTKVFLNGELIGGVENPVNFVDKLKLLRRNALINIFTSIAWKIRLQEIRIHTDPGRGCRPLIIIENEKDRVPDLKTVSWFDLVFGSLLPKGERIEDLYYKSSYTSPFNMKVFHNLTKDQIWKKLEETQCCIEFVDIEEQDTCMVAMYEKNITPFTTHREVDPSSILSIVTNNVPFANHNFAARLIFYGAQSKQAVGIYTTNYSKRFDTMGYILNYTQKPILTTKNSHYSNNDKLPAGFNTIVAIATYSGYNQEDGVIINKTSLDRGLFHVTAYKSYSAQESSINNYEYIMFANPLKLKKDKKVDIQNLQKDEVYQLLDDQGIIIPESFVAKGSKMAVIGMVHVKEELKEIRKGVKVETKLIKTYTDVSLRTGVHHYGIIDKVYLDHSGPATDYNRVCKVRFRKIRRPEFGDKMCSRHGQKGVIGMILPEEDMPFSKEGIVPDIIINPHAIPSRMTIGHLIECLFAKLCTMDGAIGDGSVFIPTDIDTVGQTLEKYGFEKHGNEVLYNGKTGKQLETDIFIGPTYYLRLKHMVTDKMHSRRNGPRDQLTRQPPSGRSNEGGLRIGEMERDVLLSYGFSQFAKESMMERSDKFTWSVCKQCGRLAVYNFKNQTAKCLGCQSESVALVQTPYAFKLLVQELETMGVTPRFITDEIEYSDDEDLPELVGGMMATQGDPARSDFDYENDVDGTSTEEDENGEEIEEPEEEDIEREEGEESVEEQEEKEEQEEQEAIEKEEQEAEETLDDNPILDNGLEEVEEYLKDEYLEEEEDNVADVDLEEQSGGSEKEIVLQTDFSDEDSEGEEKTIKVIEIN